MPDGPATSVGADRVDPVGAADPAPDPSGPPRGGPPPGDGLELRLRAVEHLFDHAPCGYHALDASGVIIDINATELGWLGLARDEVVGARTMLDLVAPEDVPACRDALARLGHEDATGELELRLRTAHRGSMPALLWMTAIRGADGQLLMSQVTVIDIARRKRIEAELRRSQEDSAELIASIDGVVWTLDAASFRFLFVSPQVERMLGYPVAEWYETPSAWVKYLHDDDRERALTFCIEETKAGRDHRFEYRMVAADGRIVWIQDIVRVVTDNGVPVRLRGVMVDVTERRAAEADRARLEHELEQFFLVSPDLMCIADLEGHLTRINPAFPATLGYTTAEMLGHAAHEFVHPDDRDRLQLLQAELRQGATPDRVEMRAVRRDGSVRWLQWSARPHPATNRVYAVGRDVTVSHDNHEERRALREVAVLVAAGADSTTVFTAVSEEVCGLLGADRAEVVREAPRGGPVTVGAAGPDGPEANGSGTRSAVSAPIMVDGQRWGELVATAYGRPLPVASAERLARFAELVVTAIANAESRQQLAASRARIVAAGDQVRRRLARDLHDGVQQHLVALALQARTALNEPVDPDEVKATLAAVADGLRASFDEVREIAHGVHPAILSSGGLRAAVAGLARRSPLPVELRGELPGRGAVPEAIELAAYYTAAEALTNAIKHAQASVIEIEAGIVNGCLGLSVRDDGIGGARRGGGLGLIGLADRVEALGGRLEVSSAPGAGTTVCASLPLSE
jgi:PAS domain S-box-containing protein